MNKKPSILANIMFIFPVMGYFLLESLIVGVVITLLWKLFLTNYLFDINYPQVVILYWIGKMLLFDVFKLITGLSQTTPPVEEQDENVLTEKDFR